MNEWMNGWMKRVKWINKWMNNIYLEILRVRSLTAPWPVSGARSPGPGPCDRTYGSPRCRDRSRRRSAPASSWTRAATPGTRQCAHPWAGCRTGLPRASGSSRRVDPRASSGPLLVALAARPLIILPALLGCASTHGGRRGALEGGERNMTGVVALVHQGVLEQLVH